ncbi:tRNA pseudouridine(55) synthase TruB [candidate division WOR-3 bacterium]|nr:tRNA pseudouridine(55) synthase TruB [candidate division WOR-3 bacterium]
MCFLLINKPIGWTSFDVVKYIRTVSGIQKIGHTGTLDPIAQGLLILCLGKSTKLVNSLMNEEKEYLATIRLGETRDTDDISGEILHRARPEEILNQVQNDTFRVQNDNKRGRNKIHPSKNEIKRILQQFKGRTLQVPPMYSALKSKGRRLYKIAREGKIIKREPRKVYIKELELLSYHFPLLKLKIICGKGTYIRALARDIGEKLGCGGCVESLTRTRIGNFNLSQAVSPKSIHTQEELNQLLITGLSGKNEPIVEEKTATTRFHKMSP